MPKRFDYTTRARAIALRFPTFNHIAIQVNFWIIAFLLLSAIIHLASLSLVASYSLQIPLSFAPAVLMSFIIGIIYGTILGFIDIIIERGYFQRWSLGLIILLRSIIYFFVLIGMISFIRYILWELVITPHFYEGEMPITNNLIWEYYFYILLVYTMFMAAVISFINQMNKKFGPGVLIPLLLGKYRHPKEEERIFMFMDLKSSTTHAEKLGHIKYSALIRDSFTDINQVLLRHNAEIYQYVGDEVVISWPVTNDLSGLSCIEFFFACQDQFNKRHLYYMQNYGLVPHFKAGLHMGVVTAVEVGEIKRDIAYHGDTLNTAARIQSACNLYDKIFLVSGDIKEFTRLDEVYFVEALGNISLKGKETPIGVYSVEGKKQNSA
jgi:adenylate cyclase